MRAMVEEARLANTQRIAELHGQLQAVLAGVQGQGGQAAGSSVGKGGKGVGFRGALPPQMTLMDTRLGKPAVFNCQEEKWEQGYFKLKAYVVCMGEGSSDIVGRVEDDPNTDLRQDRLAGSESEASLQLCLALVMHTGDTALRLVESVGDRCGAKALHCLLKPYSPSMQGRVVSVLNFPRWPRPLGAARHGARKPRALSPPRHREEGHHHGAFHVGVAGPPPRQRADLDVLRSGARRDRGLRHGRTAMGTRCSRGVRPHGGRRIGRSPSQGQGQEWHAKGKDKKGGEQAGNGGNGRKKPD